MSLVKERDSLKSPYHHLQQLINPKPSIGTQNGHSLKVPGLITQPPSLIQQSYPNIQSDSVIQFPSERTQCFIKADDRASFSSKIINQNKDSLGNLQESPQANNSNANSVQQGVKQNYGNSEKKNTPSINENHYIEQKAESKLTPKDVKVFSNKVKTVLNCSFASASLLSTIHNYSLSAQNKNNTSFFRGGRWGAERPPKNLPKSSIAMKEQLEEPKVIWKNIKITGH